MRQRARGLNNKRTHQDTYRANDKTIRRRSEDNPVELETLQVSKRITDMDKAKLQRREMDEALRRKGL